LLETFHGPVFCPYMTDSHHGLHHGVNFGALLDVLHKKAASL
jgi:hypothetical protein